MREMAGIAPATPQKSAYLNPDVLNGKLCFGCNLDFKISGRNASEIRPKKVVKGKISPIFAFSSIDNCVYAHQFAIG